MKSCGPHPSDSLSQALKQCTAALPEPRVTLGEILKLMGTSSVAFFCLVLAVPVLFPIAITGFSIPSGILIAAASFGILLDRTPWLPALILRRSFRTPTIVRMLTRTAAGMERLERFLKPRLLFLSQTQVRRFSGGVLLVNGLLLMLPLPIPFSNVLPALAIVLVSAGLLERDGLWILMSYAMTAAAYGYVGAVIHWGTAILRGFGS